MMIVAWKHDAGLLAQAQALLDSHCPGPGGLCQGCHELGHLTWSPCPQAGWAGAVVDAEAERGAQ